MVLSSIPLRVYERRLRYGGCAVEFSCPGLLIRILSREEHGTGMTDKERDGRLERGRGRRAHSFVSRGAEVGIQALLSGTPFLRVSTLFRAGESRTWKDSPSPLFIFFCAPPFVLRFAFNVPPSPGPAPPRAPQRVSRER